MTAVQTESHVVIPVRFTDLDLLGHVNHACVLTYCEEQRVRMLRALDEACPDEEPWTEACVVARVEADYLLPVTRADWTVSVTGGVVGVGRSSVRLRSDVATATSGLCATVSVTLVRIGRDQVSRAMGPSQRRWWTERLGDVVDVAGGGEQHG